MEKNILNNFKIVFGQYCATNQFVELSMRCTLTEHENDLENRPEFIKLASKYSLTLTSHNVKQLVNSVSRSYIINVHACFEVFLSDLLDHIKQFGREALENKEAGDSLLKYICSYVYPKGIPTELKPSFDVCEYYRLVRNDSAHGIGNSSIKSKDIKKAQALSLNCDAKYCKLKAPNAPDELTFDDFVMFARSANTLVCALYSSFEYDYNKILFALDERTKSKIRKLKGDRERSENYIYALICTEYKGSPTLKNDIHIFCDSLIRSPNG